MSLTAHPVPVHHFKLTKNLWLGTDAHTPIHNFQIHASLTLGKLVKSSGSDLETT